MGATNSETKNNKYYSLKCKSSEQETVHFAKSEKINGSWTTSGTFDTMVGTLSSAAIREKEYQGAKYNVFVLGITDEHENALVEMPHASVTYSIISSLCSLPPSGVGITDLMIRVYKKRSDDGKWWSQAYLEFGGQKLGWGIKPNDAPKKVPVLKPDGTPFLQNGKAVYDDSAMKAFWEEKFNTIVVPLVTPRSAKQQAMEKSAMKANENFDQGNDGDLPF